MADETAVAKSVACITKRRKLKRIRACSRSIALSRAAKWRLLRNASELLKNKTLSVTPVLVSALPAASAQEESAEQQKEISEILKSGDDVKRCPDCKTPMEIKEGCATCPSCGYSGCSLG